MKKIIKSVMLSLLMILVFALPVFAKDFPSQTNVPLDKEWKITFSQDVNGINKLGGYISDYITLYRTDVTPEARIDVIYGHYVSEPNSVRIMHDTPFVAGASYRLSVSPNAVSKAGVRLSDGVNLYFTTQAATITPPSLVTAIAISSSEITLQWSQVSGADYYYVYMSDDGNTFRWVLDDTGKQYQYNWSSGYSLKVSDINANTTKYFKVTAVKNGVESAHSDTRSATTLSSTVLVTPDIVESYIDGTFTGWTGSTIFSLRNGQIWQQSLYAYWYHYAYAPRVTITKTGGLYKMKVDGVDSTIYVTRLK